MKHHYYYFIASLPLLEFGMRKPPSYDAFLNRCEEQLSPDEVKLVKGIKTTALLKEWKKFDTTLKNEIVKCRAAKKGKDPLRYIRGEGLQDPFVARFARRITREDSPLEAERALDRFRWEKTEELSQGHYFDIDFLVTYALQLEILERWERINSGGGIDKLQKLLEKEAA